MVRNIGSGFTGNIDDDGIIGPDPSPDPLLDIFESANERIPARIGTLEFTYADPSVSVTTEQRTVEHETLDDDIVVQTMGRLPDQISVEGVVTEDELFLIDNLTESGVIELRTERWKGNIVVKSTSTDFKRAKAEKGKWLYDATIECIEVEEEFSI